MQANSTATATFPNIGEPLTMNWSQTRKTSLNRPCKEGHKVSHLTAGHTRLVVQRGQETKQNLKSNPPSTAAPLAILGQLLTGHLGSSPSPSPKLSLTLSGTEI
mmetsp:Transcript_80249/g.141551  ORF Transcript_80249/g.141551 Transcript_80249/m.141551 type:complete len:104 (-) Transcript_80249:439-750(-)